MRATDEGVRSAPFTYHLGEIERALGRTGPARRHLAEALRIHPSFSPLHAPRARAALDGLGEPDPDAVPKDALPGKDAPPAKDAQPVKSPGRTGN